MVERAARNGTVHDWRIERVVGASVLRGWTIRPNVLDGKPPYCDRVAMRLLWWSHGVFGCSDSGAGTTHLFKEGAAAADPFPGL